MSLLVAESQKRAYEKNGRKAWINVPKIDGGKEEHAVEKHGIKAHFIQFLHEAGSKADS